MIRFHRANQIVTVRMGDGHREDPMKCGKDAMNDIGLLCDATMVVDPSTGCIHAVDTEENLLKQQWYKNAKFVASYDMRGRAIVPGFVDAHTHPCWAGDRVHEFELKLAGATYMDIHKAGGGIGFTVRKTKEASQEELERSLATRFTRMLRHGTTLCEAKSGYGLELDTELKMLKAINNVAKSHSLDVSVTYLGAHSVPAGSTAQQACRDIVHNQIPKLADFRNQKLIKVDNIDVFMEKGVFEREESRQILEAGKSAGFAINFHGDELHPTGSAELGAELGARSISHLEEISDEGIRAMVERKVVGVLLPTTAHILRIRPPPARTMIDRGMCVALGSDFNPNAHCMSMPFVMNLACVIMKMTVNEALCAATLNAAASVNRSREHGSLEAAKWANFVVVAHPDWRHLIYEMVDPPIDSVWVRGQRVFSVEGK